MKKKEDNGGTSLAREYA
jgi:hypothetical protein